MNIYYNLPEGASNEKRANELMKLFHMKDARGLRKRINFERTVLHLPIISISGKYFRSDNPKDYIICANTIMHKDAETIQSARSIFERIPDNSGQINIEQYLNDLVKGGADER